MRGLGSSANPECGSVPGKGEADHPGCHVLSLMGARTYSINPGVLQ